MYFSFLCNKIRTDSNSGLTSQYMSALRVISNVHVRLALKDELAGAAQEKKYYS